SGRLAATLETSSPPGPGLDETVGLMAQLKPWAPGYFPALLPQPNHCLAPGPCDRPPKNLRVARPIRAQPLRIRRDPHPPKIEPVRVPAYPHHQGSIHQPVAMFRARRLQPVHL